MNPLYFNPSNYGGTSKVGSQGMRCGMGLGCGGTKTDPACSRARVCKKCPFNNNTFNLGYGCKYGISTQCQQQDRQEIRAEAEARAETESQSGGGCVKCNNRLNCRNYGNCPYSYIPNYNFFGNYVYRRARACPLCDPANCPCSRNL